jgi:hypothetical protein
LILVQQVIVSRARRGAVFRVMFHGCCAWFTSFVIVSQSALYSPPRKNASTAQSNARDHSFLGEAGHGAVRHSKTGGQFILRQQVLAFRFVCGIDEQCLHGL